MPKVSSFLQNNIYNKIINLVGFNYLLTKSFFPKPKVKSKVVNFLIKNQSIDIVKLEYFMRYFFINKRKIIKSNPYFKNKINKKYLNFRYEDLKYCDILEIYKEFNFSIC